MHGLQHPFLPPDGHGLPSRNKIPEWNSSFIRVDGERRSIVCRDKQLPGVHHAGLSRACEAALSAS